MVTMGHFLSTMREFIFGQTAERVSERTIEAAVNLPKLEKDNYCRMEQGLAVASTALQDMLEEYVPHSTLLTVIHGMHPVWRRLDKQQTKLVKQSVTEGYKNFDIPLTYKLLRNVCFSLNDPNKASLPPPTRGWEKDPHDDYVTPSDDIERLRLLRNSMHGYSAQAAIPETEYREKWDKLKEICGRLQTHANKDYVSALTKLENYVLSDIQLKELIQEMQVLGITSDRESDTKVTDEKIKSLFDVLREINQEATENVLVEPLLKSSKLSIDEIYAPVSIRKDLENRTRKQRGLSHGTEAKAKPVNKPEDIFLKNGRRTRFVMMQGGAGRGKSVYCLQLMKYWCDAKNAGASKKKLSDWKKRLDEYEFLFLIKLRHVFTNVTSLVDMICNDVEYRGYPGFRETIRHVLSSDKYTSLVLVDGLDEWKGQYQASSQLAQCCIPETRGISNTTIFFTMRPWKFDLVAHLIQKNDRVLEIQGLKKDGINTIAENVLINYFDLDNLSPEYESQLNEIKGKARNKKLKSLLQVPLIAVVSVILWYNKEDVGECMTTFYIALVRMLIERAFVNKTVDQNIAQEMKNVFSTEEIPKILLGEKMLKQFIHVLLGLGEIAYRDLMSKETRLVFEKVEIEEQLGKSELEFALKVGLLTQSDAPGPAHKRHVSFHFFHKSVQEFLMGMYVSSKKEACKLFLENLSSIEAVMEYENVIMFLSGLSPSLGHMLSQHIVSLTHLDPDFCRFRETLHYKTRNKVDLFYHLQLSCLRELKQTEQQIPHTTQQRDYHISDVYVVRNSDTDTLRMTADVLRHHNTNIVSLSIHRVPNDRQDGIDDAVIHDYLQQTTTLTSLLINGDNNRTLHTINTVTSLKALVLHQLSITPSLLHDIQTSLHNNTHIHSLGLLYIKCVDSGEVRHDSVQTLTTSFCGLLQNLPSCKHLSELDISYMLNKEERDMLVNVLPHLSHLKVIDYYGSTYYDVDDGEYDYTIVHMVSQWTQLQVLWLGYISLGDRSLELTADMDHIEEVGLYTVKMSAGGWGKFITSLINIQHQFDVELWFTDISADCVAMIRSSPHFTVTHHDEGKSVLYFTRKFPPTSQTQEHDDDDDDDDDDD